MSFTCLTPIFVHGRFVPCGKCGNCTQKRSLEWSFRLKEESKVWRTTSFITLTYAPEFEPENGVQLSDIQKFIKLLRSDGLKFKYYATSEYGPTHTHRPHYHIMFFHDLMPEKFYEHIENRWSKGIVTIGDITECRVMYVSNYHITKAYNPENKNENFCVMSKGLGASFLSEKKVQYFRDTGHMYVKSYDGFNLPMSRYYKNKILFSPEQKLANQAFIEKQSLWDENTAYALRKKMERIDKIVEKKLKKRKNIR